MKLIELHILQSFPVSCLNRDDVGAPKTAIFGGAPRARISSQCLKRAIREYIKDPENGLPHARFGGIRSKLLARAVENELKEKHKLSATEAAKLARSIAGRINKREGKPLADDETETETLIFFSPAEVERLAAEAANAAKGGSEGLTREQVAESIKRVGFYDAADIALFGRMVAAEPSLTLEGAALFSHALSTHKADNDIDFFSALDEWPDRAEEPGAGMIDTLQFTSACYYRYAGLNLDLLFYQEPTNGRPAASLSCFAGEEHKSVRHEIVEAFIRAVVLAVPGARKNSMNAHTLPGYVLGLVKDKGQPLQLINAFEKPVRTVGASGFLEPSVREQLLHLHKLEDFLGATEWDKVSTGTYRPAPDGADGAKLTEKMIPEHVSLGAFCKRILDHVN
jgi:CRISPR system Cascade subunit CasC